VRTLLNWLFVFWKGLAKRSACVALLDMILLLFAAYMGYAIRLTLFIPRVYVSDLVLVSLAFSLLTVGVFCVGGQYRVLWVQAGLEDYLKFARLYLLSAIIFTVISSLWRWGIRPWGLRPLAILPRTSLVIMLFAGVLLCGGLRVSWRFSLIRARERPNALIVGAGEAGAILARDLMRHGGDLVPLGFVDDDPAKQGKSVSGLTVLGHCSDIAAIARSRGVKAVLVAIPSANRGRIRALYDVLAPLGLSVRVLPSLSELANGSVGKSLILSLRHVSLEDLLGREPVQMDMRGISDYLRGRSVLVTGAGGSIGSEIVRQVLGCGPREVIGLGHGEQSIYLLTESESGAAVRPVIADVADETAMRCVFEERRPAVVFHAAAHKHVPLMEDNPREALRVNALGTRTVARLAGEFGAERMVLISTDKAVNPTSVMGASKRAAEVILGEVQEEFPGTVYTAVRFGNVLGSRGSVVPKFERQIADGGPVTVTDPAMKRYFMLIPEAVSLVIQAGAMGRGLFVLDMGEPVPIAEMAELLIRLHGYEPGRDIKIVYTGPRPGEKLSEELFYDPASVHPTPNPKVFASNLLAKDGISAALDDALRTREGSLALLESVGLFSGSGSGSGPCSNGDAARDRA
jgi:FlaA1/EpsC-like NDP-sugar epimerase